MQRLLIVGAGGHGCSVAEVVLATLLFVLCVHYIRLRVPRKPRAAR